jgi:hypothetical protein
VNLSIDVDVRPLLAGFSDVQQRQIPFALSQSINDTMAARDRASIQSAVRSRLHDIFTLRRPEFHERSIKVVHFASKREPWGTIGIHPPGGDARADILGKFETDTEKRPRDGRTIAVPIRARRNKRDIIVGRDRPRAFNFVQVGRTVRGDRGTFIIRKPDGSGLILQRFRRKGVFALYRLVHRVDIDPDLRFVPTSSQLIDRMWADNFVRRFDAAMRTAR